MGSKLQRNLQKLVTAAKRATPYGGRGFRWEVALVYGKHLNAPFRPEGFDAWGGDLGLLSHYTVHHLRVGKYLECWVYNSEELVDNVYIHLDSETSARVQVSGEKIKEVSV